MDEEIVKNILLRTGGSFTDQIDHKPYSKFGKDLIESILEDAFHIHEEGGSPIALVHHIRKKYLK